MKEGLKKHFNKHKKLYIVGAGVIVGVIVKREYDKNILNAAREGSRIQAGLIWDGLTYEVEKGNLAIDVVGEIEIDSIRKNVTELKSIVKSEG